MKNVAKPYVKTDSTIPYESVPVDQFIKHVSMQYRKIDYCNYDWVLKKLPEGYQMVTSREIFHSTMLNRKDISPCFVKVQISTNDLDAPVVTLPWNKLPDVDQIFFVPKNR